ncbi:MAG: MarR family transcriptional regulator [Candidatus Omnitrophica bacterium]|nr:MarR family transcriptional regulator [Candidatus Omnitrophota bacterium]
MTSIPVNAFADKLNEIIPVLMKEFARRQKNELFRGKITLAQFFILAYLYHESSSNMTDLARFMDVTTAAITGIVSRLVKAGYVLRQADPKDRRIINVKLAPKGKSVVEKVNEERHHMIIDIFGRISEDERGNYLNILTHIKDILVSERKEEK